MHVPQLNLLTIEHEGTFRPTHFLTANKWFAFASEKLPNIFGILSIHSVIYWFDFPTWTHATAGASPIVCEDPLARGGRSFPCVLALTAVHALFCFCSIETLFVGSFAATGWI